MKRIVFGVISLFLIIICVSFPVKIYAADAVVIFGSDSYEKESGEEFPIGVYIDGDSEIGYYKVEIEYDRERLKYLEGASDEKDGKLVPRPDAFGSIETEIVKVKPREGIAQVKFTLFGQEMYLWLGYVLQGTG